MADVGGAKAVREPFAFVDTALRATRPTSTGFQTVVDECELRAMHLYLCKM